LPLPASAVKTSCSSRITSARCQPLELSSLQVRGPLRHPRQPRPQPGTPAATLPKSGGSGAPGLPPSHALLPEGGDSPSHQARPAEPQSSRGTGLCQLKQALRQKLMVQEPNPVQVGVQVTDPAPAPEPCPAGFSLGRWRSCQVTGCWCGEQEAGAEHCQVKGLLSLLSGAQ